METSSLYVHKPCHIPGVISSITGSVYSISHEPDLTSTVGEFKFALWLHDVNFSIPICLILHTGRVELPKFLTIYLLTLQLITTGSLLTQGSTSLVVLTALHAGAVANLFWSLLANTIVATQVVEDGPLSSLILVGSGPMLRMACYSSCCGC